MTLIGSCDSESCDACDGLGYWVEGQNPERLRACPVCDGTRVVQETAEDA